MTHLANIYIRIGNNITHCSVTIDYTDTTKKIHIRFPQRELPKKPRWELITYHRTVIICDLYISNIVK